MTHEPDTIFALASGTGRSAIAVVRISGPDAGTALRALAGVVPPPRIAKLTKFRDPESGDVLDRGVAILFPAPKSLTGEDVVELHLHGGPAVVAGVTAALSKMRNLRPAEAGEFTRRAFLNGKLDLTEVEGIADLIAAETEAQRKQAMRQMAGAFGRLADAWADKLKTALAYAEARIDFAEDDPAAKQAAAAGVPEVAAEIEAHLGDSRRGERLREGFAIAILGPPNAGKSSLLNLIAGREAAIVSTQEGTTRDVIEVHLDLAGLPVTLADTAGLRETAEEVESEGVRRALARAEQADLKLVVIEAPKAGEIDSTTKRIIDAVTLVAVNKSDLLEVKSAKEIKALIEDQGCRPMDVLLVSAKTGAGLDELLDALERAAADRLTGGEAPVITRARHRRALESCLAALRRFEDAREPELAAEELRTAVYELGRITGRVDVEDLLDVIFRDFCIGK